MQYRQLYNLTIRHAFYKNDQSPDFTILPTPECERLLRDYRLVVKYHSTGLKVMVPIKMEVDQTTKKLKEVPFISIPESVELSFWLKNNNPALPIFTDLDDFFSGGLTRQPIFSNKDLPDSGTLDIHQMTAFQTDEFFIPKNQKTFPVILKNKPLNEGIDLHIFLKDTNQTAQDVLDSWESKFDNEEKRKGFSMEIVGDGTDILKETTQFEKLYPPFQLNYPVISPQVEITYHGKEIKPKIEVKQKAGLVGNALFTIGEKPPQMTIESFPSPQNGKMVLPRWSVILDKWKTFPKSDLIENDNKGFRFKLIDGAGDNHIQVQDFEELKIQETPEWVLPEIGLNGLKIIYNGEEKVARVKVFKGNGVNDFHIQDEPVFEITGITENNKPQFLKAGNALIMDVNQQDEPTFKITYPVQPTLPWGVFGQVKTQLKKVFFDFLEQPTNIEFDVRFEPAKRYWKYYVISEIGSNGTTNDKSNPNIDDIKVIKSLNEGKFKFPDFFIKKATATHFKDFNNFGVLGSNTKMELPELDRLWKKVNEIEANLSLINNPNLNEENRILLVSKQKIPCKEYFDEQLTLELVINKDLDIDEDKGGIQPETFKILLSPPKNDEIQIIKIKEPEIATT